MGRDKAQKVMKEKAEAKEAARKEAERARKAKENAERNAQEEEAKRAENKVHSSTHAGLEDVSHTVDKPVLEEMEREFAEPEKPEEQPVESAAQKENPTQKQEGLPTSVWDPSNLWVGAMEVWHSMQNFAKDPVGSFTTIARKIGSLFEDARNGLAVMLGPTIESLVSLPWVGEMIVGFDRTRSAFFTFLEKHGLSVDLSDTTKTVSLFLQEYKKQWKETYPSFDDFMDAVVPYLEGGVVTVAGLFAATEKLKKGEKKPDGTTPVKPEKVQEKPTVPTIEKTEAGILVKWNNESFNAKAENNNILINDTAWEIYFGDLVGKEKIETLKVPVQKVTFEGGKIIIEAFVLGENRSISKTPEQFAQLLTPQKITDKKEFSNKTLTFVPVTSS